MTPGSTRTGMSQGRLRLAIAVTAGLGFACQQGIGWNVLASNTQSRQRANPPASIVSDAPPITMEFDLPADFFTRARDGAYVIRGFRVGYFRPERPLPVWTGEFRRDAVKVDGQTARLSLPQIGLPEGSNRVVVRISSMSREQTGVWSDPSAAVTMPIRTTSAPDRLSSDPRKRRHLTRADLERRPALKEALSPLLGPGLDTDAVVTAFRSVDDLATAIVLSRRHELPFAELCKAIQGSPPQSLRDVLGRLRPSLDVRRAFRDARVEARRLLTARKN